MIVFLAGAMPIFYLTVNSLFKNEGVLIKNHLIPFGGGALLYIPALLISWFIQTFFRLKLSYFSIYWDDFITYTGFNSLFIGILVTVYLFLHKKKTDKSRIRELTGYLTGFFFSASIHAVLVKESSYGSVELFALPLISMGTVSIMAFLFNRAFRETWLLYKSLYAAGALLLPFALNFAYTLSFYQRQPILLILATVLCLGGGALLYLEVEDRIPGGS